MNAIPELRANAGTTEAIRWLRQVVSIVGPGFHVDTPAHDYVNERGEASFSAADCQRLDCGLGRARQILGNERVDDECLEAVWACLGVRYDERMERLIWEAG